MEISVVIPLYNKAEYIARALDSVFAQKFRDFEVTVVNDSSTDGGEKIAIAYKHRNLKLVDRQKPRSLSAARNRGIGESSGNLLAFLDADDEWTPEFLETIMRLKKNYPEAGLYATAYKKIYTDGKIKKPVFKKISEGEGWEGILPDYFFSCLHGTSPVIASGVAIPKKVFASTGMFSEDMKRGEDKDMWARIALKYPVAFSRSVCAVYYVNIPGGFIRKTKEIHGYKTVKTIEEFLRTSHLDERRSKYIKEYANLFRLNSIKQCIETGNINLGIKHLRECRTRMFRRKKLRLFLTLLFLKFKMTRKR